MTSHAGLAALAVALATTGMGCFLDNDVMDASCTPDGPDINLNSDCPYEEGKGPQLPQQACEAKFPSAQTTVTWTDVFGLFTDAGRGNCSAGNCHGIEAAAGGGIFLPADDPNIFYQSLKNTTGSVGRPYLVVPPDDPLDSWIHCNVAGTPGGGLIMPKPAGLTTEDAQLVEDWLHGGARGPGQ
jgi:hypothetical protein